MIALWHLERKPPIPMSTRQEFSHCFCSLSGERTCMSPHETRTDAPVETPEEPRDAWLYWRGNLRFRPQFQMRTLAPAETAEESREALGNSPGDWTFLRPTSGSLNLCPLDWEWSRNHWTTKEVPLEVFRNIPAKSRPEKEKKRWGGWGEINGYYHISSLNPQPAEFLVLP